jgi:acyl carrier protein
MVVGLAPSTRGAGNVADGDHVLREVTAILGRYNTAGKPIEPATDLAADLNVDSVAAMDVIMEIEDRFGIDIPINLVSDITTVADLVALVERQINSREAV